MLVKKYKAYLKTYTSNITNIHWSNMAEELKFKWTKILHSNSHLPNRNMNKVLIIFTRNPVRTTVKINSTSWELLHREFANYLKWEIELEDNSTLDRQIEFEIIFEIVEFAYSMKKVEEEEPWMWPLGNMYFELFKVNNYVIDFNALN